MGNKRINNLKLRDFKELATDYWSDDFMVVSSTDYLPDKDDIVRLNFFSVIICMGGRLQLEINGEIRLLQAGDMIFCLPAAMISNAMFTIRREIRIIGFSMLPSVMEDIENMTSYICKFPIHITAEKNSVPKFSLYNVLIANKIKEIGLPFTKVTVQFLLSALFYEILAEFKCYGDNMARKGARDRYLFKRFVKEVEQDKGIHRSVTYFASLMCYSAKHISNVVKRVSGRTASDWIHDYAIKQITFQLKHTEKSIKEIAVDFGFPNQSFFGKYVKSRMGISPKCYRDTME